MRSYWIKVGPMPNDCWPYKKKHTYAKRHREDGPVMTLSEMGVMQPYLDATIPGTTRIWKEQKKESFFSKT